MNRWLLHPACKPAVFVLSLGPLAWLFAAAVLDWLGANPAEALMRGALPLRMDRSMRGSVYLQLGSAVAAQGRLDEAMDFLERALEYEPGLRTADLMLAEIRRRKGQ